MSRTQGLGDLPRPAPAAHGERGTRLLPGPPAKALLERLALQLSCAPLELYKSFLSDCTSANHAPNAVSILEEELASRFYGPPDEEPRYCSMDKANDLSFLRLVSGVTFVVYQRHKSFGLLRVFDNRVQLAACLGGSEPSPALVFLLDDVGDGRRLYEVPGEGFFDPAELRDLSLRIAPRFSRPQPVGDCLLSALASVLGVEPGSRRGGRLWSLADVLLDPVGVWEALRTPFALAEHVGVQPWKWKQRNANQPFRQRFKVLLTVYDRPGGGLVPWPEVRVVCLSYHGYLTLVDGPNTERLLQERTRDVAARPGERLAAFPSLARPGSQEHLDEQEYLQLTGPDKPAPVDHRRLTPCECQLCRECNKYQDNLERCGSQKLYTVDWDLFTYLRALGLDSEEHQAAVREALSLSVSGMDLETSTVSLAAGEASPEGGLAAPHEKITFQSRQGGSCELAERILLIGHIDNLGRESGSYDVEIFESGRRPAGVKNVVHSYVRYVCVRQRKMELRKRLLLRPLLEFASEHRRAHLRCLEEAGVELRSALGSWDFSLLGRFEKRLEKLCRKYYVYAFNGSGFDFPLLCGHLSTAPWMRRQWSIQRNGSSVTMMSMGGRCIYFRGASELLFFFFRPLFRSFHGFFLLLADLKKMLGPGASLASLASTVGLKQSKMIFPYGILRGYGEALDEPALPEAGPRWFDALSQTSASPEQVAEAHRSFRQLGCSSIRDYLNAYLEVDLVLLLKSTHLLLDNFCALTGVAPVDCDKSTVSSYSMYCSQMFLVGCKRPGAFCNNNPAIYNVIRNSLRGGLTMVTRTSVNAGESESLNQPHLGVGDEGEKAKAIHYLDVSGLYSAAGEQQPFLFICIILRFRRARVCRPN